MSQLGVGFKVPVGTLLKGLLISIYEVIGVPLDTMRYLTGLGYKGVAIFYIL